MGRRTPLVQETYQVGRENSEIVIARSAVSRAHAKIKRDSEGAWCVADLGSTNGTFVNEARVKSQLLKDGDQVRFGDVIYKFLYGANVESSYHEQIHLMAIQDGLTGVYNKRYFTEFMDRELAGALRHGHPLSLVMADIDFFKKVNDQYGHLGGDAVLKDFCGRIKPRMRREDLFARYGGEEFAWVLVSTPIAGAIMFAEALRALIAEKPCTFDGNSIAYTVSLGISTIERDDKVAESVIKRADEHLYTAKRAGRNRVVPTLSDLIG